ncbi:hypothetical protein HMPREF1624_07863 [Sporothrix schenckii ATCC 58251]|uniref:NAD+ kinase n=1 Tax=Sporothrix schenckii (strain ATCC 58251 / de Perez 2211183) TaxID=1391915 RepID=U7PJG4_SPOS1|nr:hypothetical protein HMPREF1624_07863 [Sporothrix schenckii ATCC 58251]
MPDLSKHITFEDGPDGHDLHDGQSSASDEDHNAVEVVFDPSNPYRRKSSLVSSEAVPPRLRKNLPPASSTDKAQCIVHHLIEAQRDVGNSGNSGGGGRHHISLPHLHKHPHRAFNTHDQRDVIDDVDEEDYADEEPHQRAKNGGVHHSIDVSKSVAATTGTAAVPASDPSGHGVFDASAERGLDRVVEPKGSGGGHGGVDGISSSNNSSRDDIEALEHPLPRGRRHTIVEPVTSDSEAGQVDEHEWASGITHLPLDTADAMDDTDREPPRQQQQQQQQRTQTPTPKPQQTPTSAPRLVTKNTQKSQKSIELGSPIGGSPLDRVMSDGVPGGPDSINTGDILHSRLLTKKQLSEMAWGVRELSRRLGSLRLRFRVKTIFLLTKIYDEDLLPKTRDLTLWLMSPEREIRYTVYVERSLRGNKLFDVPGLLREVHGLYVAAAGEGGAAAAAAAGNGPDDIARRLRFWDEGMCRVRPHTFDFVITLGGDGTVLYASWLFQRIVPPVLSFSLGSLGFLTKFDFEDYQSTLTRAFAQGVTVGLRLRFEATIMRSSPLGPSAHPGRIAGGNLSGESAKALGEERSSPPGEPDAAATSGDDEAQRRQRRRDLVEELIGEEKDDEHTHRPDGTYEILNEIVVDRGPNPTMSYTEIFGDDEHFTSVLADGICVSTPTGSTAYNLAAGGSLCHPENPVMLVTSICAHTLSFRPIILPDTIVLRVGVPYDARTSSWASFDGRERVEMKPGDYVTISASRFPFASVQAPGRRSEDWVNSISGKLGWNTRQKQKAYKEWDK